MTARTTSPDRHLINSNSEVERMFSCSTHSIFCMGIFLWCSWLAMPSSSLGVSTSSVSPPFWNLDMREADGDGVTDRFVHHLTPISHFTG